MRRITGRIPLEHMRIKRRRRISYGTASLLVVLCLAGAAFWLVVALCAL